MKFKFFLLFFCISTSIYSQSSTIKDLERQRKQALREIENTNKLLQDTKKTTSTLLNRIKLINSQISSRQQVVSLLNIEINHISAEQDKTQKEITALQSELGEKQSGYAKTVQSMVYKKQRENRLLFILSGKSFGESVRRMYYLKDYSESINKEAEDIKKKSKLLSDKKTLLEQSKTEKLALLTQREAEQMKLVAEEKTQKEEVSEASKKQKELQTLLSKKQKQANALNAQIERLIAEEVARQEREAKRIADEKARIERNKQKPSQPKVVETPHDIQKPREAVRNENSQTNATVSAPAITSEEDLNLSTNFVSNKGRLPMPVTGRSSIVSRFGTHQHSEWITTNNNGIDIQALSGAEARSIFGGEVSRIIAFPGFNNCVIIRHGGYYSFYGNIQNVYIRQGEKVKAGQAIGRIYTDPDVGSSQLHFQLWKGTTKLNPEPWLKR